MSEATAIHRHGHAEAKAVAGIPTRLMLSRRLGFDLQAHSHAVNGLAAVKVARPSQWGNPFVVGDYGTAEQCVRAFSAMLSVGPVICDEVTIADQEAVAKRIHADIAELRGRNLACWCREGDHCHADVLLALANGSAAG